MMDEKAFEELMAEIQSLGYNAETAAHYAALIGDTPGTDPDGRVVVRDLSGKVLAKLRLKFFGPD